MTLPCMNVIRSNVVWPIDVPRKSQPASRNCFTLSPNRFCHPLLQKRWRVLFPCWIATGWYGVIDGVPAG